ncbi:hypothetical protein [Paraburkholderia monticola]|uniref:hypothetical protein n=1 Tax=Paraburkholderia monticola TaxID=1399968 RepID=UPI00128FEBE0|nr:hypothetical protein [Paraburkholderia monticola]
MHADLRPRGAKFGDVAKRNDAQARQAQRLKAVVRTTKLIGKNPATKIENNSKIFANLNAWKETDL